MREIIPDVFTWPWFSERFQYDFNGYLVADPGGAIVIDPVEMPDAVLDEIVRKKPSRIVLTNRNHFRAAARVREAATFARVAVHPADAAFVREKGVPVDDSLAPGDRVGPFVVVAAPGKSPGEVVLHWPERRILVVGDACVAPAPGRLGLLPAPVLDDAATLKTSLRRISEELDFDILLACDGHPILNDARAALRTLVATF